MRSPVSRGPIRRKHHTRSRGGCCECKQRHVRCDELKPSCTSCMVHGRDCHYRIRGGQLSDGGSPSYAPRVIGLDPFDVLPISMPFQSMRLLHHGTHYRLLTSTVVAKNPNTTLAGLVTQSAAQFRIFLLIAGIHLLRTGDPSQEVEMTMMHHKLEAIRAVNGMIGDPSLSSSEACIISIAGLALVEAAQDNTTTAEMHLKVLMRLLDERQLQAGSYVLFGLFDRIILLAASIVAASKDNGSTPNSFIAERVDVLKESRHFTRPTRPVFSAVPFLFTHLSPFYDSTPPDIEACNADAECEIIATTLRRLSVPWTCNEPQLADDTSDDDEDTLPLPLSRAARAILRDDAESYIVSLLFKPSRADAPKKGLSSSPNSDTTQKSSVSAPYTTSDEPTHARNRLNDFSRKPFAKLPPAIFPSTSRAWASAAYLYLHLIVDALLIDQESLECTSQNIDPHLLRGLLRTLNQDLEHTEEAMRIGAYSSELWLWKAMVGRYAESEATTDAGWTSASCSSRLPDSKESWFAPRLQAWSAASGNELWQEAKQALRRIAWPELFDKELCFATLWDEALNFETESYGNCHR